MADFLRAMSLVSHRRVQHAMRRCGEAEMRSRASDAAPAPEFVPAADFDVIAEVKRRAPSTRKNGNATPLDIELPARLARLYSRAGAAAVSVLTEPLAFDGDLDDLVAAARAAAAAERPIPVMRKDFVVSPYQVFEARAAGAGGVLLIADMLDGPTSEALVDAAVEAGTWILVEAFTTECLDRAAGMARAVRGRGVSALVGVNSRDLRSLRLDVDRLSRIAPSLPPDIPGVAESGLRIAADAARVAGLGYRMALVGSALVAAPDPERALAEMIAAGRAARRAA